MGKINAEDVQLRKRPQGQDAQADRTLTDTVSAIIERVKSQAQPGTHVVIMSNGGFGGLHGKLAEALK